MEKTYTRKLSCSELIEIRVIEVAEYIIENKATMREAAKEFGVSVTTIHKDVASRLPVLDIRLSEEVDKIVNHHLDVRHLRGGKATKLKSLNGELGAY